MVLSIAASSTRFIVQKADVVNSKYTNCSGYTSAIAPLNFRSTLRLTADNVIDQIFHKVTTP